MTPFSQVDIRKYNFDGIVLELGAPQFFESLFTVLADKIHLLPGDKRLVVVIPPYHRAHTASQSEVTDIQVVLKIDPVQSKHSYRFLLSDDLRP